MVEKNENFILKVFNIDMRIRRVINGFINIVCLVRSSFFIMKEDSREYNYSRDILKL